MVKSWMLAGLLALVAAGSQAADGSELKSLVTGNDSRGWEAVGRLNFAGHAFCTGALIAPDLVLTARIACLMAAVDAGIRHPKLNFWPGGAVDAPMQVRAWRAP